MKHTHYTCDVCKKKYSEGFKKGRYRLNRAGYGNPDDVPSMAISGWNIKSDLCLPCAKKQILENFDFLK